MGLVRLYVENIHDIEKIAPNIESLGDCNIIFENIFFNNNLYQEKLTLPVA